ncbi:MAG: cytochrome c peroxidase [Myxococcales bacterium]|jgi:cytochrome c peroxidase|nr:cytochrome c peroxidase [Myxococcales bacterium]
MIVAARTAGRAAALAALLLAGCNRGDRAEFTELEWSRLQTLSADAPPALPWLLGLGLPPRDLSNDIVVPADRSGLIAPDRYPVICRDTDSGDGATCELLPEAQLGQQFYFDPRFSGVATLKDALGRPTPYARAAMDMPVKVSCADCHDLGRAGTDPSGSAVSAGAGQYDVNGLGTVNAAFFTLLYWNGRSDSLWQQASQVTVSKFSMNGTRPQAADVIRTNYHQPYVDVFKTDPMTDDVDTVFANYAKAIAAFEQTLVGANAPFDQFLHAPSGAQAETISPAAKRGARLFVGKAGCYDCHNTPLFSDGLFHNIGVPQVGAFVPTLADCASLPDCTCDEATPTTLATRKCLPWGAWDGLGKLRAVTAFRRDDPLHSSACQASAAGAADGGTASCADDSRSQFVSALTGNADGGGGYGVPDRLGAELIGAWRTPSLRNVALTAPYMHDGLYQTLEEVIGHYNRGGDGDSSGSGGGRLAVPIKPLDLADDERHDLVAFLKTLTGAPLPPRVGCRPALPGAAKDTLPAATCP